MEAKSCAVALSANLAVRILPPIVILIFMSCLLEEAACRFALEELRAPVCPGTRLNATASAYRNSLRVFIVVRSLLFIWAEEHFYCTTLVHSPVTLRNLIQRKSQIENFPRVDLSAQHEFDEFRQVAANRRRSTVQVDMREKLHLAIERHTMRDADVTDITARARRFNCLHHRLPCADALQDRFGTDSMGERRHTGVDDASN